jgi:DNA-binding response OmpR family regulator
MWRLNYVSPVPSVSIRQRWTNGAVAIMTSYDTLADSDSDLKQTRTPYRVLIVDDDAIQAEILSMRLTRQGFETLCAGTGRDGLHLARSGSPNLVLLDLRLPDVDGLNICQELTDDSRTCSIPIIILSGMERPDIIRRSREAGCRYYVRKPYDPNALLMLVESAISECQSW